MSTKAITPLTPPKKFLMEIKDMLIIRYRVKIKTILGQPMRPGGGVCLALMEKWLKTGLISDSTERKKERAAFRKAIDWDKNLKTGAFPQDMLDRQEVYMKLYDKSESDNQETLAGITALNYQTVDSGGIHQIGAFAAKLAFYLTNTGDDPPQTMYFHLRLAYKDNKGQVNGHAVGLKRGKQNTMRHYSMFDPNTWEVTKIPAMKLGAFLKDYAAICWEPYTSYQLFRVSPKSDQPKLLAASQNNNSSNNNKNNNKNNVIWNDNPLIQ